MEILKQHFCFTLIVGLFFVIVAVFDAEASAWTGETHIDWIMSQSNGNFILHITPTPADCEADNGYMRVQIGTLGMTPQGAERLFSIAQTSLVSGNSINWNYTYDSSRCFLDQGVIEPRSGGEVCIGVCS